MTSKLTRSLARKCTPLITGDGSRTHYSERYQQSYHSTFGAITESMHVFVDGAGVQTRLSKGIPTRVLEIGFGLGLNFLLSAECARQHATGLYYASVEHDLISCDQFAALDYPQIAASPLVQAVHQQLSSIESDNSIGAAPSLTVGDTTLQLYLQDACSPGSTSMLAGGRFDAVFLDAFSPEVNPECWTPAFLHTLFNCLTPGGQLASYCVKGVVTRALKAAGFEVQKRRGPPGKREVLLAIRPIKRL